MDVAPVLSKYLTFDQLAEELGVSPRTLARWKSLNETPPVVTVGRKRLYRREAVEAWLLAREKQGAA